MRDEQDESAEPIAEAQNVAVNEGGSPELRDQEYSNSFDNGSTVAEEEIKIEDNFSLRVLTYATFISTTTINGAVRINPCMGHDVRLKSCHYWVCTHLFPTNRIFFSQFPFSYLSRMVEWTKTKMLRTNERKTTEGEELCFFST